MCVMWCRLSAGYTVCICTARQHHIAWHGTMCAYSSTCIHKKLGVMVQAGVLCAGVWSAAVVCAREEVLRHAAGCSAHPMGCAAAIQALCLLLGCRLMLVWLSRPLSFCLRPMPSRLATCYC